MYALMLPIFSNLIDLSSDQHMQEVLSIGNQQLTLLTQVTHFKNIIIGAVCNTAHKQDENTVFKLNLLISFSRGYDVACMGMHMGRRG